LPYIYRGDSNKCYETKALFIRKLFRYSKSYAVCSVFICMWKFKIPCKMKAPHKFCIQ